MSRLHLAALVALSALVLPTSPGVAQVFVGGASQNTADRANQGRATEDSNVYHCQGAAGGSRVRPNCEFETETARAEQQIKLSFKLAPPPTELQCSASTTTASEQRNTIARIKTTLEIRDCTVASGTFTVALGIKDESGADKPLEFTETWQRSDEADVQFTADYPIGENMELVSARLRRLTCTCADPAAASDEVGDVAPAPEQPLTEN
jgi:hypothetical protein